MLINQNNSIVEFISYNYGLSLCHGDLKFKIKDKFYEFDSRDRFWISGGSCRFNSDYTKSYVNTGDWIIDVSKLPEELKEYAVDIDYMMNKYVPHGCCGACL